METGAAPSDGAPLRALSTLLAELIHGAAQEWAFILNPGDPGLLRSLARLSAAAASTPAAGGGPPIAAHVEHLRYGLDVLNRWHAGEDDVFEDTDYAASWRRTRVSDTEWQALLDDLRAQAERWHRALQQPRALDDAAWTGMLASVAHLAYHTGAIRQIDRATRGPAASD